VFLPVFWIYSVRQWLTAELFAANPCHTISSSVFCFCLFIQLRHSLTWVWKIYVILINNHRISFFSHRYLAMFSKKYIIWSDCQSFFFLKNYYFDYERNNQLGVISIFSLKMEETNCSTNFDAPLISNMLTWTSNSDIASSGLSDLPWSYVITRTRSTIYRNEVHEAWYKTWYILYRRSSQVTVM